MIININNKERFFNDSHIKWTKKWFPRIKIWYIVYVIICFIIFNLYFKEIINNNFFIIYLPFIHWFIMLLFILIPEAIYSKHDFDYIEKYYPEISKKIWPMGRGNGIQLKIGFDLYYPDTSDEIIDEIVKKGKKKIPLIIIPFLIAILNVIIYEFIR